MRGVAAVTAIVVAADTGASPLGAADVACFTGVANRGFAAHAIGRGAARTIVGVGFLFAKSRLANTRGITGTAPARAVHADGTAAGIVVLVGGDDRACSERAGEIAGFAGGEAF